MTFADPGWVSDWRVSQDPRPSSCREAGHTLTSWYDFVNLRRVFRHNDNPEHVMFLDDIEIMNLEPARGVSWDTQFQALILHRLILWTDRIHEYEDAALGAATPDREGEGN